MGKDFGDGVLPLQDGRYMQGSTCLPEVLLRWGSIIWPIQDLLQIAEGTNQAAWTTALNVGGSSVVVILMPSSSVFAQRWASGMNRQTGLRVLGAKVPAKNATDTS